ncbi:MAG: hypothetical protein H5T71_07465, partial [Chloroflexi bacterium]|nr:hypothetical protein [Chloroflexota bacterium]
MAIYQLWVLDETFTPVALLNTWHALTYRIALNAVGNASVSLAPNDPNIVKLEVMQRLRIVRDGEDVWGGPIVALSWGIAPEAPQNDTYTIDALDDAIWAAYRTIPRPEGEHF